MSSFKPFAGDLVLSEEVVLSQWSLVVGASPATGLRASNLVRVLGRSLTLCIVLTRRWLSKLLVCSDRLLFLAALEPGTACRALCTTLFAYNWHFCCVNCATHSPISIITASDACVWVVQVANEIAFILLGSDDPFLSS